MMAENRHGAKRYLVVPEVSSERRKYLPVGFFTDEVVQSNLSYTVPNAGIFELGILSLLMHAAWLRVVCGRMKSDFRYSAGIVYNNFPWPDIALPAAAPSLRPPAFAGAGSSPARGRGRRIGDIAAGADANLTKADAASAKLRAAVESAAQGVLDARAAHPESSLADLYDPITMPPDLTKAHQKARRCRGRRVLCGACCGRRKENMAQRR